MNQSFNKNKKLKKKSIYIMACGCKNKQNGGGSKVIQTSSSSVQESTPEKKNNRIIKREIR